MIVATLILAVAQIYFFAQYSFWGLSLLTILPLIYLFRREQSIAALALMATGYAFVVSIFLTAETGLQFILATLAATIIALGTLAMIRGSRLRFVLKRYSPLTFALVFLFVYWGVMSIGHWPAISLSATALFVVLSALLNAAVLYVVSGIYGRVSRRNA